MQQLSPATCAHVDLDCETCTRQAAKCTARLCSTLSASHLESAFFRIFREPGCAQAMPHFAQAYFEATAPVKILRMSATVAAA